MQNGSIAAKQFALVSYLPDPLAQFLDDLRLELVPGCQPRAHVTILPPRAILPPSRGATAQDAISEIRSIARRFKPFRIHLGEIARFPVSNVVYIELATGREQLFEMYRAMNSGLLSFREPFPYCPHITLAQRLSADDATAALKEARRKWDEWRFARSFQVESMHFVESDDALCWRDLGEIPLPAQPPLPSPTRRVPVAPLHPA
jgi:2'-5' RNA ligase